MSELITTSEIPTTSGIIQGFVNPVHDIHTFLGIPYAEPPIGDLRFRPPVPYVDSSQEIKICMEHAPAAPQTQMPFDTLMSVEIDNQSEDCLYLNIWAPDTEPDSKRPVLIWFHPGACMR
ncbi:Carboxylesterase [Phycomyces nitens]|nr:Carboxylesterase [Phycomyces nitens]